MKECNICYETVPTLNCLQCSLIFCPSCLSKFERRKCPQCKINLDYFSFQSVSIEDFQTAIVNDNLKKLLEYKEKNSAEFAKWEHGLALFAINTSQQIAQYFILDAVEKQQTRLVQEMMLECLEHDNSEMLSFILSQGVSQGVSYRFDDNLLMERVIEEEAWACFQCILDTLDDQNAYADAMDLYRFVIEADELDLFRQVYNRFLGRIDLIQHPLLFHIALENNAFDVVHFLVLILSARSEHEIRDYLASTDDDGNNILMKFCMSHPRQWEPPEPFYSTFSRYLNDRALNRFYETAFIQAVFNSHFVFVNQLLTEESRYDRDYHGNTALHIACANGNTSLIHFFLVRNFSAYEKNYKHETCLFNAIRSKNDECVRLICSQMVFLDDRDDDGKTALHLAIQMDYPKAVELLVEFGASLYETTVTGNNAIMECVETENLNLFRLLYPRYRNLDFVNSNSESLLMMAFRHELVVFPDVMEKTSLDIPNRHGETVFSKACFTKQWNVARMVFIHFRYAQSVGETSATAVLARAIQQRDYPVANFLRELGASWCDVGSQTVV